MPEMKIDSDHVTSTVLRFGGFGGFFASCVLHGIDQITKNLFLSTCLA